MPGRRCSVFGCNNSRVVTKRKGENIVYHDFPKGNDVVSSALKKEWFRLCKRADKWNPNSSQICSVHFTFNDYERDLQNELLGLPIRKKLKKTAVPTVHLPLAKEGIDDPQQIQRSERLLKRKQSPQQELTDFCSVQTPAGITQEQFEFLETPITIKEEPLIYLNIEASLPENVCVAEGSTRVKEEPEDIKREKDEDQITQNFESRVEGLDYNASDVEPGFIDVKKERDEDEEPQILESGMEDLDTHNPNATEEPVQIDPATDWRELDVVDLMFLDFARRFKQLSARTQIEVNSRLSQIITEAEVNEIKQRKQNL